MRSKTLKKPLDLIAPIHADRVPLSTRVKKETKVFLSKAAKNRKIKLSSLTAAILDGFVTQEAQQQGKEI